MQIVFNRSEVFNQKLKSLNSPLIIMLGASQWVQLLHGDEEEGGRGGCQVLGANPLRPTDLRDSKTVWYISHFHSSPPQHVACNIIIIIQYLKTTGILIQPGNSPVRLERIRGGRRQTSLSRPRSLYLGRGKFCLNTPKIRRDDWGTGGVWTVLISSSHIYLIRWCLHWINHPYHN